MPQRDLPDHMKFGYAANREQAAIRDRLRAEGVDGMALHFAVAREYERTHANDPTFRERSAAFAARCRELYPPAIGVTFGEEELAHIIEHFQGANDATAISIAAKAAAALAKLRPSQDQGS